jgi:hypothetical protein
MSDTAYYLSAVVGSGPESLEVRTKICSTASLNALLEDNPAAITLAPSGAGSAERLLDAFTRAVSLMRVRYAEAPHMLHRWRYYKQESGEQGLHLVHSVDSAGMIQQLVDFHTAHGFVAAFIREGFLAESQSFVVIESAISEVFAQSPTRQISVPRANEPEAANRRAVHAARQQMLDKVGSYSSEELASALDSTTSNASQCAADQRNAGKVFGVRYGQKWHSPEFQFDATRKPYKEMKAVLEALSPDARGWDRLQWFLEPHEKLSGHTPLEVWETDRRKVIEAAHTERWHARD